MNDSTGSIPSWDHAGHLPPFFGEAASPAQRSPYLVGLADLALRFGDTQERRRLIAGLLDYRAALHAAGLQDGFQWIDGSFVEDTMVHSQREPADIDVVTFFRLVGGQEQQTLVEENPSLFDPRANRRRYGVDAYTVDLDGGNPSFLVRTVAYWNSLWSHDRNQNWKGYLEVDLLGSDDAAARAVLDESAGREEEA